MIAFQKANKLKPDGIAGKATQKEIDVELEKLAESNKAKKIQKMLDNLKNDKTLGLSKDQKTSMIMAAERLLKENFEVKFVAGVLGNIMREGSYGEFEDSAYRPNSKIPKPPYLDYMDKNFEYRKNFSGKNIQDIGIKATLELLKKAKQSGYKGKFGLGMVQWTEDRTEGLLKSYQKYAKSDKPTKKECMEAEINFMVDELKGEFSDVYEAWKNDSKTARKAGEIFSDDYVKPGVPGEATERGKNAVNIYNIMTK